MKYYFDNAATTCIKKEVIEEMNKCMKNAFGNPSANHSFGRIAKNKIEVARKKTASFINAESQEIIFTSGGTEASNMILFSAVKDLGIQTIISTKIEHHATINVLENVAVNNHVAIKYLSVNLKGEIDFNELEKILAADNTKKMVALMFINNEIGNILDLEKVSFLCEKYDALFYTDAVQGIGHFKIDVQKTPIDFLAASAHKFHGPKGIGFAYIKKKNKLSPFLLGGTQEKGLRGGTEPVQNITGLEKALELSYENLNSERKYIQNLKKYFIEKSKVILPECQFNGLSGDLEKSTYTLLNIGIPIKNNKVAILDFQLDLKGIACSKGSACQSGNVDGSHVLQELKIDKNKLFSLRFSFSIFNTKQEIDYVLETIKELINS